MQEELELIERVRPALVVGDFRLSLAVSAAVSGVRCATLINAYWSPYAERDGFPVPDHPIVSLLGVELAERYFPRAIGSAFARTSRRRSTRCVRRTAYLRSTACRRGADAGQISSSTLTFQSSAPPPRVACPLIITIWATSRGLPTSRCLATSRPRSTQESRSST